MAQFRNRLGERQVVFVFLASEHPGIPDIEILDKLLDGRSVLLTQDRVLHNLAIGRGFRSMIKTSESGLTDRRLAHVAALDRHLPVVRGALRDSYAHQANPEAQAITGCVSGFLSAHQLKQFRTKRRRIRAHFGSSDNILAAALIIGQRRTTQGIVGGYMLKVDARHGVKSLFPASESYFLDRDRNEPLHATCWALAHLFQLLQNYPLTLYHLESAALARCAILVANRGVAVTVVERMVARLFAAVFQPNAAKFHSYADITTGVPQIAAVLLHRASRQPRATSGHTKTSWATSSPTGGDQAHFRRARIARPITQSLSLSDKKLSSSVKWVTRWR
jgi:hypothetical protein